jgi:hypothetical protein
VKDTPYSLRNSLLTALPGPMSAHMGVLLEHCDNDGHLLLYLRTNITPLRLCWTT